MIQLGLPLQSAPMFAAKPFVEGEANADAIARTLAWPAWPGGVLALTGAAGVGKSHLAALWAERVGASPLDCDAPAALPRDARVAEDADRRLASRAFEETLFHALNRAAQGLSGPLLLTGRTPPAEWPCTLPDLRSRLNALPVAMLGEPDDALLRALLISLFRERSVRPGVDLLDYLVRRIERSAAGAAAIVEALDVACREGGRLGRALARELLHDAPEDELGHESVDRG